MKKETKLEIVLIGAIALTTFGLYSWQTNPKSIANLKRLETSDTIIARDKTANFSFKHFPIGIYVPPAQTESDYKRYEDTGFNLVFNERYKVPDFKLAEKHKLGVIFDTYSTDFWFNDLQNSLTNRELEMMLKRFGKEKSLAGIWLMDDCMSSQEARELTRIMKQRNDLFPFISFGNILDYDLPASKKIKGQSSKGMKSIQNPIFCPQIYPSYYPIQDCSTKPQLTTTWQMRETLSELEDLVNQSQENNLIPWAFVNTQGVTNEAILRFQTYSAVALGVQGILQFTDTNYFDGSHSDMLRTLRDINLHIKDWEKDLVNRRLEDKYQVGELLITRLVKPNKSDVYFALDMRPTIYSGSIPEKEYEVYIAGKSERFLLKAGEGELIR